VEPILGNTDTYQQDLNYVGKLYFGNRWRGVFAADRIPHDFGKTKQPEYAIVNLDKHTMPGSHWVSLASNGTHIFFYDSFGRNVRRILPDLSHLAMHRSVLGGETHRPQQKEKESNCGARAMAWLLMLKNFGP
jgi:hypothetical protein